MDERYCCPLNCEWVARVLATRLAGVSRRLPPRSYRAEPKHSPIAFVPIEYIPLQAAARRSVELVHWVELRADESTVVGVW